MNHFVAGIRDRFQEHHHAGRAAPMKAYMRHQFDFIGISSPERRALTRDYFKAVKLPDRSEYQEVVKELWALEERDFQYFAIELAMKYKRTWNSSDIRLFEYMATRKSWWDTVDTIANKLIGPWLVRFPEHTEKVTGKWNRSDNIWLQRLSIIFQLTYRKATNRELLAEHIIHLSGSGEFFVQKAIGWSLRQYSKYDPRWVRAFVETHQLKPLSRREALKIIGS